MAGKEPLLGTLKACVLGLQASGSDTVTDDSPHVTPLCDILEMILRKGLRSGALGMKRRDYWHWIEDLPQHDSCGRLSYLSVMVEKTNACPKLLTAQGRGRYFLRMALNGKSLVTTIQHLQHTCKLLERYDPSMSVLGNEDFMEPFLCLLLVASQSNFSLDLQNSSFLDESWILPVCTIYQTVPCRELGMVLRYLEGRVFVIQVLPDSQAEVDEVVLAGDVIDEINGVSMRNAYNGQAGNILNKLKGEPLIFRLIRWRRKDGELFRPLIPYIKIVQEKMPTFQLQQEHRSQESGEQQPQLEGRLMYALQYLGQAQLGTFGGKEVLDMGITKVRNQNCPPQDVLFDIREIEIVVQEKSSNEVLFRHQYPEISSVGRRTDNRHVFALCVV
ncbi:tensin-like C1 domain-containing phosphatase [Pelobates cultripes]|nr:tensin-like C1 domain-containing phosphatase [Pelobates cultripes]